MTDEEIILNGIKQIEGHYPVFFKDGNELRKYIAIAHPVHQPLGVKKTNYYSKLPDDIKHEVEQSFRFFDF